MREWNVFIRRGKRVQWIGSVLARNIDSALFHAAVDYRIHGLQELEVEPRD